MEAIVEREGYTLSGSTLAAMEDAWVEVKEQERRRPAVR
jgi:hypothetical protein